MRYIDAVRAQGKSLRASRTAVTDRLRSLDLTPWRQRRLALVGMGASSNAISAALPGYWEADLAAAAWAGSEFGQAGPATAAEAVIAVSQTGTAFRSVPRSLSESARLDGASSVSLLWRILVPNVAPAVKTMAALVFLWTWNAFLLPLVMVSNSSLYTVTVGLSTFTGAHFNNYSALAAGSCLAALPVVVIYLFAQRSFIAGLFAGSLVE